MLFVHKPFVFLSSSRKVLKEVCSVMALLKGFKQENKRESLKHNVTLPYHFSIAFRSFQTPPKVLKGEKCY